MKVIECPRDAMQGLDYFVETEVKAEYINKILRVGFEVVDFGSFVSPKAIPQMRDTRAVLEKLDTDTTRSKLLVIVANSRGAREATQFEEISFLGYPFSISETFQIRNTNASIAESLERVKSIQDIAGKANKRLVIYISMGFGNPYGDEWNVDICQYWVDQLADMGIRIIALSDTIGVANPASISYLYTNLIPPYPDVEFGAHFHTQTHNWHEKLVAAYESGCQRFDGAIRGFGGCPMAKDELTGNMPTEYIIRFMNERKIEHSLDLNAFKEAMTSSSSVFQ